MQLALGIAIAMTAFRIPGTWVPCIAAAALGLPWLQYCWGHHPNGERYTDVYEAIRIAAGGIVAPLVAAWLMRGQSRPFAEAFHRNGRRPAQAAGGVHEPVCSKHVPLTQ